MNEYGPVSDDVVRRTVDSAGLRITEEEIARLTSLGFDLTERWPEYGRESILEAYRAGKRDAMNAEAGT